MSSLFNRLPGFTRSPPGLEHRIWRRLPAILLWGTALPLLLSVLSHAIAPDSAPTGAADGARLLRDYILIGVFVLHVTLVFTLGIGCFIVRVMKGPAYVADPYPLPRQEPLSDELPATRPPRR